MGRGILVFVLGVVATTAYAQPNKPLPPLVGAMEVVKLTTQGGFIDDAVTADAERLVYVVADSVSKAELRIVTLATKAESMVDLSAVTLQPVAIQLVGARAFVVGRMEDNKQVGAMVELADKGRVKAGTVVYKVAPANHITVITRDGKPRIAVHRAMTVGANTKHEAEILAIENGRRIGVARSLELDAGNKNKALDFRVNHWSDGWTRAHGLKGGEWDRKENQRSPDVEATYDFATGKVGDTKKIGDLFEQRKRYQTLVDHGGGKLDFVRIDGGALQLWRGGKSRALEIDQPLSSYDGKSMQTVIQPDGALWLAIKVDPVNAEAVARQKADPEYLDIFRATPDGKAVRKARLLAKGTRHRFGVVAGEKFWLVERNQSMERGGKSLTVYQLQ